MAGASISKLLLVFRHMNLSVYDARTFFYHQSRFLFPNILKHWETYQSSLISEIKTSKDVIWSGEGRFDSMSKVWSVYITLFTSNENCSLRTITGTLQVTI